MTAAPPHRQSTQSPRWAGLGWDKRFGWGVLAVGLLSFGLHHWGLERFNTLVFDEVYYARFASQYLMGVPLFGGHPPLSTYILAAGIWIAQHTPIGDGGTVNGLTGLALTPVDYRWLNATVGTLLPLIAMAIADQLGQVVGLSRPRRQGYSLAAGLCFTLDGFFLVESRYALINLYLVIFGLIALGAVLWAIARNQVRWRMHAGLLLSGIALGASVAVKWNGLGFVLGLSLLLGLAYGVRALQPWLGPPPGRSLLTQLAQIPAGMAVLYWAVVPAITYYLTWIPFIRLDSTRGFWAWHAYTLAYHSRIGGMEAHPYCSPWYTWPLMLRPIAYLFKTAHAVGEPPPVIGPPLPATQWAIAYDVHALGNPLLWWLSTAAIALMGILLGGIIIQGAIALLQWVWGQSSVNLDILHSSGVGIALFLVVQWGANWLPWMLTSRCVFIYHYMSSLAFALLAIAWFLSRWLQSALLSHRMVGAIALVLIVGSFLFWLPLYLGLPLTPEELHLRQWFRSWI
jgi:dolichyl-phosphate-mannose-protein mannosyltransferase